MSDDAHSDLGPELRRLAQAILDRLDPAVRAAAGMADDALRSPGRCQQVWCPVCALAALVSGEAHPLLSVIAEHSVALMSVVRGMAADPQARTATPGPEPEHTGPEPADDGPPPSTNGRYHHIPIVIETVAPED